MSPREIWRQYYRTLRVARREQRKAAEDLMLYGTGIVVVPKEGDPYRLDPKDFFDIRTNKAGQG